MQNTQIASLTSRVDTLDRANVQLAGEKAALTDTVSTLVNEKNTVYYVVGTKDELIQRGVLVEEGHKRLLLVGSRSVAPARELNPSLFTRIDRVQDRVINLPAGEYMIFSRQNPTYASPLVAKDGKISGGLRVEQPEKFWAPSTLLDSREGLKAFSERPAEQSAGLFECASQRCFEDVGLGWNQQHVDRVLARQRAHAIECRARSEDHHGDPAHGRATEQFVAERRRIVAVEQTHLRPNAANRLLRVFRRPRESDRIAQGLDQRPQQGGRDGVVGQDQDHRVVHRVGLPRTNLLRR